MGTQATSHWSFETNMLDQTWSSHPGVYQVFEALASLVSLWVCVCVVLCVGRALLEFVYYDWLSNQ